MAAITEAVEKASGKAERKPRQSPGELERLIHSDEGVRTISPDVRRREAKRLSKAKARLKTMVCSSSWLDDNWQRGVPYPPGGDDTRMVRCPLCGVLVPPGAMEPFNGPGRDFQRVTHNARPIPGANKDHSWLDDDRRDGEMADGERMEADSHLCADHKSQRYQEAWGESPSARAIQECERRKVRVEERVLKSEKRNDLKREVARKMAKTAEKLRRCTPMPGK